MVKTDRNKSLNSTKYTIGTFNNQSRALWSERYYNKLNRKKSGKSL